MLTDSAPLKIPKERAFLCKITAQIWAAAVGKGQLQFQGLGGVS